MRKDKPIDPLPSSLPKPRSVSAVDRIIGANLRALRLAGGYAQRDVGAAAGVSFQQMQKYENGSNRLSLGTLLALRRFYNVPLASFLYGVPEDLADLNAMPEISHAMSAIGARLVRLQDPNLLDRIARIVEILTE